MNMSDTFDATSLFAEVTRRVMSQTLESGSALAIFGNVTVDLTQAHVGAIPAAINVTAVFGNVRLILPEDWAADNQILQVFGNVHDRRDGQPKMKVDEVPQATLSGVSVFGNVEIATGRARQIV